MAFIDERDSQAKAFDPVVRVILQCLRQDLDIFNITIKDSSILNWKSNAEKEKIAEAYIRTKLTEIGFLTPNSQYDPYCNIVFGETIVLPK